MPTLTHSRRFHFGLTVADLDASVRFYEILLGAPPVKHYDDYAKFDVADPPVVLALHPGRAAGGGVLNHVGFRLASSEGLVAVQQRLEMHGISTLREENVECCYALQTKFWVTDPDQHLWEVYTFHEDLDHSGFGGTAPASPDSGDGHLPVRWQHMLTDPLPEAIADDETIDEIILEGTFNASLTQASRIQFLRDAWRALRPGGRISVHGLVASEPFPGRPRLPGPAAMVEFIPVETDPARELHDAGFVALNYDKFGDIHCFQVDGIELRELRLSALKPLEATAGTRHYVIYRGPMECITDDNGRSFRRGVPTPVEESVWRLFQREPFATHFTCCDAMAGVELTERACS